MKKQTRKHTTNADILKKLDELQKEIERLRTAQPIIVPFPIYPSPYVPNPQPEYPWSPYPYPTIWISDTSDTPPQWMA